MGIAHPDRYHFGGVIPRMLLKERSDHRQQDGCLNLGLVEKRPKLVIREQQPRVLSKLLGLAFRAANTIIDM